MATSIPSLVLIPIPPKIRFSCRRHIVAPHTRKRKIRRQPRRPRRSRSKKEKPSCSSCSSWLISLEPVLQSKLQNARRSLHRRDAAERPQIEVGRRVAPVKVIQQIERLQPKFDVLRLGEVHVARQRKIDRPRARSLDAVDRRIAEGSRRRLRERGLVQIGG